MSFSDLFNTIVNVDKNLGFKKFVKYLVVILIILTIINYKIVIRDIIEVTTEISNNIHNDQMELRDQLLAELKPMLVDMRSSLDADRILYFEYHNSKENLISIPFKYLELVQYDKAFAIPSIDETQFQDINTGLITDLYQEIKFGGIVCCDGPKDSLFMERYRGIYDLINSRDGSVRHAYISVPGIDQPVGLIILEWMNESNVPIDIEKISKAATHNYIPRINAMILSKSPEKKNRWFK